MFCNEAEIAPPPTAAGAVLPTVTGIGYRQVLYLSCGSAYRRKTKQQQKPNLKLSHSRVFFFCLN